ARNSSPRRDAAPVGAASNTSGRRSTVATKTRTCIVESLLFAFEEVRSLIPPDSLRLVRIRHLTSRHAREVRCELVSISTVLTRRSTSERAEFTDQMRLVEETKVDGDLCPANRTRVVQAPDNTLKTHDPCKALRRHANFVGEPTFELAHGETET